MKKELKFDEILLLFVVVLIAMSIGIFARNFQTPSTVADKIANKIILTPSSENGALLLNEGAVNEIKLIQYSDLKKTLGISRDFCIVIEDENGEVLLSKGNSKLSNNDFNCME